MPTSYITLDDALVQLQPPPKKEGDKGPKGPTITKFALQKLLEGWGVKVIVNKGFPASYMARLRSHFNAHAGKTGMDNAIKDADARTKKRAGG